MATIAELDAKAAHGVPMPVEACGGAPAAEKQEAASEPASTGRLTAAEALDLNNSFRSDPEVGSVVNDHRTPDPGRRTAADLVDEALVHANERGVLPRFEGIRVVKDWDRSRLGYRFVKRTFDICFSACVLAVIAVPSLVLAAAIRAESPGNPFYGQVRVGRTHRDGSLSTFRMWKFRSMYADADKRLKDLLDQNEIGGAMFKMRNDPRVTRIGHFIRKHSIDEFPQFLNVFLGDMSVVGPRPPLPREVREYTNHDLQRLAVKPGITGLWQATDRNNTDFDGMVHLDLEYITRRSLVFDLKLILLTVGEVFKGEGAS